MGRVDDALDQLRQARARDGDTTQAVHETRKDLKKARSVLRLVREGLERERYREQNSRLRYTGRLLADARDAAVKLETLRALADTRRDEVSPELLERLSDALEAERRQQSDPDELASRVAAAQRELERSRGEIAHWDPEGSWGTLSAGLQRSYGRGRDGYVAVRERPGDEGAVHEWRKRVKDLWYQLRLLRDAWEGVLGATADELDRLSDLLGEHHDLAVLVEDVEQRMPQPDGDAARLVKAARARQADLLGEALPIGERVYAERPKRFAKRLGAYWEAWRRDEPEPRED